MFIIDFSCCWFGSASFAGPDGFGAGAATPAVEVVSSGFGLAPDSVLAGVSWSCFFDAVLAPPALAEDLRFEVTMLPGFRGRFQVSCAMLAILRFLVCSCVAFWCVK